MGWVYDIDEAFGSKFAIGNRELRSSAVPYGTTDQTDMFLSTRRKHDGENRSSLTPFSVLTPEYANNLEARPVAKHHAWLIRVVAIQTIL